MISPVDLSGLSPEDIIHIREYSQLAWDFIPDRLRKAVKNFASSKWNSVVWSMKAEAYFSRLYTRVASTRLLGHPKELRVSDIFTDVYIYDSPLSSKRGNVSSFDAKTLKRKRTEDEGHRRPAAEILTEKRIYLTGKPGAGKTTLLRYLAIQSISSKAKTTPIYIALKDVAENVRDPDKIDLFGNIVFQFADCKLPNATEFVDELLKSGRSTLMLDGLDEVTERNGVRSSLITQTLKITNSYPKLRVILTCRVGADAYTFEKFSIAQIADFSPKQQVTFVKRWYGADPGALRTFMDHWAQPENEGLRDLASTPLLLALLCIGFDETREFPLRRGDLYKEAVDALLRRWSLSRGIERDNPYKKLTTSRKEQLLSFIAFRLFKENHFIFHHRTACEAIDTFLRSLPRREIDDGIEATEVLLQLEAVHGLIIHETSDFLAFSHLTIHEYFSARYLIDSTNEKTLRKELTFETLANRQWREVILLAVGSVTSADYILSIMRGQIEAALAAEPTMRKILRTLSGGDNAVPQEVWGDWVTRIQDVAERQRGISTDRGNDASSFTAQIQNSLSNMLTATLAASFSPTVTRRAYTFAHNLSGPNLLFAKIYFTEGPPTRMNKFLNVLYVEELFAMALATGTVTDRAVFEMQAFRYE